MQTSMLDAGGRIPAPATAFERRIAAMTQSGGMAMAQKELVRKQALPLRDKISLSLRLIRDWYESWDGKVSVSYSGGKDSSVLLWLVRSIYPDVPAVFCNTGMEYPEVVRMVLQTPNHIILRPKMHFSEVVRRYGWPVASKRIARGIHVLRHPTGRNQNIRRLYDAGINRFGQAVHGYKIPLQWRFLIDAPFEVSDHCCAAMKKDPAARYERTSGRKPFVGTMASDSKARQRTYLQQGCNAYDMQRPRSAPMSFWTEQDVLQCITEHNIPIPPVYGDVCQDNAGRYCTTGVHRTGCVFCCFGLHMDEGDKNRFELLAASHPRMHRLVMERLGLGAVLDYCREQAPARLANAFRCGMREAGT